MGIERTAVSLAKANTRMGKDSAVSGRMPPIRSPKDLIAWQLCDELADLVRKITATGPVTRDFELCDQVRRSSGAPAPQIAEGFGRFGPREFARYLTMAVSSLMETDTWLARGSRYGYWSDDTYKGVKRLCDRALDITRKLLASKLRQIEEEKRRKLERNKSRLRTRPRK